MPMKCFNHQETEAVAVCVSCGKALCPSCISKSSRGKLVCSALCAQAISEADDFRDYFHNRSTRSWRLIAYAMLFPVSFIFLVFGGFAIWAREWPIVWLLLSVVVIFVLAGLGCLRLGKRMVADEMSRG
jgi:hypothetical protein